MSRPHVRIYCWAGFLGNTLDWKFLTGKPNLLEAVSVEILPLIVDPLKNEDWGAWTHRWLSENPRSSAEFEIALGYSLGGRAAAHLILEAPGRWNGLIAISAHPGLESSSDRESRVESDERWASRFETEDWTRLLQDWNAQSVFGGQKIPERLNRSAQQVDPALRARCALQLRQLSLGKQSPLHDRLIKHPLRQVWLTGENDPKLSTEAQKLSKNPNAIHQLVSKAGHRWPWEIAEKSAQTLIAKSIRFLLEGGQL